MTVLVRLARADDLAVVGLQTVAAYSREGHLDATEPYADELRNAADRADSAELWVAEVDGKVVGSVTFCPAGSPYRELASPGEGEFRMLAVAPEAQGRGVGRRLIERCVERSTELGYTEVVLCSMPTMRAAHSLYASFGFTRDESLDWRPDGNVELWGYRAVLGAAQASAS